jgi:hypothetical protein
MRNRIWFARVGRKLLGSFILTGMIAVVTASFFCAEVHAQAKPAKIKIKRKNPDRTMQEFSKDLALIKKHTQAIVLSSQGQPAKVVVTPALQGRVLTSTAGAEKGVAFGWFDRKALATMSIGKPAVSVLGGEDRLLVGPEGTKFSFFYPAGTELAFPQRKIPGPLDLEGFEVVQTNADSVLMRKNLTLVNRAGNSFAVEIQREVRMLTTMEVQKLFGMMLPDTVKFVAYQTDNRLIHKGGEPWSPDKGLVSLRVLGAQTASPTAVAVVPYHKPADVPKEEKVFHDNLLGVVPEDRVAQDDNAVYFLADSKELGKVGVISKYSSGVAGSYDPSNKVLTVIHTDKPDGNVAYAGARLDESQPILGGESIYLLNEGPLGEGGKSRGRFFVLETASPAPALKPGEALRHVQRTVHFQGSPEELDLIIQTTLKTSRERIEAAFDVDEDEEEEQEEETEEEESEDDETGTDE